MAVVNLMPGSDVLGPPGSGPAGLSRPTARPPGPPGQSAKLKMDSWQLGLKTAKRYGNKLCP